MSKVTYLDKLTDARKAEHEAKFKRCYSVYKNLPKKRWLEVMNAYNRALIRKARRSVGRSNRYGTRQTALGLLKHLNYMNSMYAICRQNRAIQQQRAEGE